ncbi:hypothetical protein ACFRCW_19815 [Streptomyces sp. NPDC056653]|uniref:hypothetical protein n=1 Tax=Streptomyces sp. NPDC056653 TaxID=3345894 RepID=UPI0036D10205
MKPANWHVALNTIVDDDGFERKIVRENMTFGRVGRGEFGTYFIGDARQPAATVRSVRPPAVVSRSRLIRAGRRTAPRSGCRPSVVASSCTPVAAASSCSSAWTWQSVARGTTRVHRVALPRGADVYGRGRGRTRSLRPFTELPR